MANDAGDEEDGSDEKAVDAVVRVGRRRPGDDGAQRDGIAETFVSVGFHQDEKEDRERRRGDETEVAHASRDQQGTPGKQQPGEPRLRRPPGDVPGQQEGRVGGQDRHEEKHDIESRDDSEQS